MKLSRLKVYLGSHVHQIDARDEFTEEAIKLSSLDIAVSCNMAKDKEIEIMELDSL